MDWSPGSGAPASRAIPPAAIPTGGYRVHAVEHGALGPGHRTPRPGHRAQSRLVRDPPAARPTEADGHRGAPVAEAHAPPGSPTCVYRCSLACPARCVPHASEAGGLRGAVDSAPPGPAPKSKRTCEAGLGHCQVRMSKSVSGGGQRSVRPKRRSEASRLMDVGLGDSRIVASPVVGLHEGVPVGCADGGRCGATQGRCGILSKTTQSRQKPF